MVEGKVRESFGPTLEEWLKDPSPGKTRRLSFYESVALTKFPPGTFVISFFTARFRRSLPVNNIVLLLRYFSFTPSVKSMLGGQTM